MPAPLEVDADTIALWHFDQTGSGTLDDECNRLDLTTNSGPTSVAGQTGFSNCREFDGVNDYLASGFSTDADLIAASYGDFTWEGWVYLAAGWNSTAWASHHEVFTLMDDAGSDAWPFVIALTKGGRTVSMGWQLAAGGFFEFAPSHPAIPLETWTHIAVSRKWNGSAFVVVILVNFEVVGATTSGAVKVYDNLKAFVGVHSSLSFNYWPGRFDDFRISNTARYGFSAGYDQGYTDGYADGLAAMPGPPTELTALTALKPMSVEARLLRLEKLIGYLFGWLRSWADLF